MWIILTCIWLVLSASTFDGQQPGAGPSRVGELTVSLPAGEFRRLEPIQMKYRLKNVTTGAFLSVRESTPWPSSLRLAVGTDDGPVPWTRYHASLPPVSRGTTRVIGPGEVFEGVLVVNEWFDMTAEGRYTVVTRLEVGVRRGPARPLEKVIVEALPVNLSVHGAARPGVPVPQLGPLPPSSLPLLPKW